MLEITPFKNNEELHQTVKPRNYFPSIPLKLQIASSGEFVEIINYSPFGMAFYCTNKIDETADFTIYYGKEKHALKQQAVAFCEEHHDKYVAGISFNRTEIDTNGLYECNTKFPIIGFAKNDFKLEEQVYFNVTHANKSTLIVEIPKHFSFVFPKMELKICLEFPTIGKSNIKCEIQQTTLNETKEYLKATLQILETDKKFRTNLGNYLFKFAEKVTLAQLRQENMKPSNIGDCVQWDYVANQEEYEGVLELRLKAYSGVGKVSKSLTVDEMKDEFDERSVIIIGKSKGKIIASVRVIIAETDKILEFEPYTDLPDDFPDKPELVEYTRFCTDDDHRSSFIVMAMLRNLDLFSSTFGRRWAYISSTKDLLKFYLSLGNKVNGMEYSHKDLGGGKHYIFRYDNSKVPLINPLVYEVLQRPVKTFIDKNNLMPGRKLRNEWIVFFYNILRPISKKIIERKR